MGEQQPTQALNQLTRWLCGSFDNRQQAFENPPLYGHILVRYRPIPQLEPRSLLIEQAYAIAPNEPYRIRVVRPVAAADGELTVLNFTISEPQRFFGAIDDPERRSQIKAEDLSYLEGCNYIVKAHQTHFSGQVEPGCRCRVTRKGRESYVISEFRLDQHSMETIDRGHDPKTHEQIWGSLPGPFLFDRAEDWSDELLSLWGGLMRTKQP